MLISFRSFSIRSLSTLLIRSYSIRIYSSLLFAMDTYLSKSLPVISGWFPRKVSPRSHFHFHLNSLERILVSRIEHDLTLLILRLKSDVLTCSIARFALLKHTQHHSQFGFNRKPSATLQLIVFLDKV